MGAAERMSCWTSSWQAKKHAAEQANEQTAKQANEQTAKQADEQAKNIENADSTNKLKIVPIVSIVFKTSASKDQASPNDRFGIKHVL